jgi:hypothetical protein
MQHPTAASIITNKSPLAALPTEIAKRTAQFFRFYPTQHGCGW